MSAPVPSTPPAPHAARVGHRPRLLMVVNPYASTVSERIQRLVIAALRGPYELDVAATERPNHATEICREAAAAGYDAVIAFGGDGTLNEAANGLAGTGVALTTLPGGRANVYCRMLGIPADVIDATEHLLGLAERWAPRAVDLGRVGERYFLFSAGVGLDASVVQRVDANPRLKRGLGEYYYGWVAASTYGRRYIVHPPRLAAELPGADGSGPHEIDGATVLVQNTTPYTYFGDRPVEVAPGASLSSGDLAGIVLRRTSPLDIPTIAWRALSAKAQLTDHAQIEPFAAAKQLHVRSLDGRALPLQLDGDYIGAAAEYGFAVVPGALLVVS